MAYIGYSFSGHKAIIYIKKVWNLNVNVTEKVPDSFEA